MYKNSFIKQVLLGFSVLLVVACDKDFNEIGVNVIGEDHYGFARHTNEVVANMVSTGPVQSNNLPLNPLGIYDNPVFGKTKAHFVTQVELATANPTIGTSIVMESVILTVPYFSTVLSNNSDGTKTYELDSLYGGTAASIDLKVYRSGYFLGNIGYEGGTQVAQKYYTDQNLDIDGAKLPTILNDGDINQNTNFFFSTEEREETTIDDDGESTVTRFAPEMRLELNEDYFKTHILEAASANLLSNNAFKYYFRGIYFKVEDVAGSPGALAMLNFAEGKITINYKADITVTAQDGTTTTTNQDRSIVLNLAGNSVSLLENEPTIAYGNALAQTPSEAGQSRLFLKGGQGSVATIDIFGNEDLDNNGWPDKLDEIREKNWLINEASLTFYVDRDAMGTAPEPNRVFLYNIPNKIPVLDYYFDNTKGRTAKFDRAVYGGILEKASDGRGTKYKVRITNYVRSMVSQDSAYVRLGLAVTEYVDLITMAKLKADNPTLNNYVPTASVINPLGTVIYGNNIINSDPGNENSDYNKRLRLEIYYTEPKNQ